MTSRVLRFPEPSKKAPMSLYGYDLDFSTALLILSQGHPVQRAAWVEKAEREGREAPVLSIRGEGDARAFWLSGPVPEPWTPTQEALLATDWLTPNAA